MIEVTLYDVMFSHNKSAGSLELYNEELVYTKEIKPIAIYTEFSTGLIRKNKHKHSYNIAWIIESPEYSRYESLEEFDLILTHHEHVLITYNKAVYFPIGGCWVDPKIENFNKTKNVSIIASEKTHTYGQKLRHEIIRNFNLDVYGRGYNKIDNKSTALFDYKFSVIIENCLSKYYFTEKLIDCFISKTIPIYFGAQDLPKEFDEKGIIRFNTIEEFNDLYNKFEYVYENYLDFIEHNRIVALDYIVPEDRLVKILKLLGKV